MSNIGNPYAIVHLVPYFAIRLSSYSQEHLLLLPIMHRDPRVCMYVTLSVHLSKYLTCLMALPVKWLVCPVKSHVICDQWQMARVHFNSVSLKEKKKHFIFSLQKSTYHPHKLLFSKAQKQLIVKKVDGNEKRQGRMT